MPSNYHDEHSVSRSNGPTGNNADMNGNWDPDLVDDEDLDSDFRITPPEYSVEELLGQLVSAPDELDVRHLLVLSDLARADVEIVRRDWPSIPVERRRTILRHLIDLAANDVAVHLGRLLRVTLEDSDPAVRKLTIEGLWEDMAVDLVGPLIQMVRVDDDNDVRAAAATALGNAILAAELDELDSSLAMRAEEALLEIISNDDQSVIVRSRALESLAYSGETGIRQLIEDGYYSPFEEMRVSALVAMGRSADIRWRGLVRAELQNPSPAMRAQAARACGELEATSALPDLIDLISDEQLEVKLAAIFALGHIGGPQAREVLDALSHSEEPAEVEAAADAMEDMLFYSDPETIPLYDESEQDDGEEWDIDPWDQWNDFDDRDMGTYEN